MKKVILAPDSFKGTMSALKICSIMSAVIKGHFPQTEIVKIPIADGGEGTVDCFIEAMGGERINVEVKGPYFEDINAFYGVLADGSTAIIEMAAAAGLPLVEGNKNPAATTTYGVGQLICHAVERGCCNIILGIGGSCTNDGGAGMAAALGIQFFDEGNKVFIPTGGSLNRITRIDDSCKLKALEHCTIVTACDVNNPLCGRNGAAAIFSPQKGADAGMVKLLDQNLMHFAKVIEKSMNKYILDIPGAGAAGGLGGGAIAFLGAELKPGIEIVLDMVGFDGLLQGADMVFTGEGKIDGQSLNGKAVIGVARRASRSGVPVIAVGGDLGEGIEAVYQEGVSVLLSTNRMAIPFEEARLRCEKDLELTMDSIMRLFKLHELGWNIK